MEKEIESDNSMSEYRKMLEANGIKCTEEEAMRTRDLLNLLTEMLVDKILKEEGLKQDILKSDMDDI